VRGISKAAVAGLILAVPLLGQTGWVRIRVVDPNGDALEKAEVALLDESLPAQQSKPTNRAGEVVWEYLPAGSNRFQVRLAGFKERLVAATVMAGKGQLLEVSLEVGFVSHDYFRLPDLTVPQPPPRRNDDLPLPEPTTPLPHPKPLGPYHR
jgi:hypothetical protein